MCKELGYSEDCHYRDATAAASRQSMYFSLAATIPMFLISGTLGVLSDRFGRKKLIIMATLSNVFSSAGWVLITSGWSSWLENNWKAVIFTTLITASCLGGMVIAMMASFAMIADLTAKDSRNRGPIFVMLEGSFFISGVFGTLLSGQLIVQSAFLVFMTVNSLAIVTTIVAIFFVKETTSEETRAKPINWREANSYASLLIALPVASTKEMLNNDFEASKEHLRRRLAERHSKEAELGQAVPNSPLFSSINPLTRGAPLVIQDPKALETLNASLLEPSALNPNGTTSSSDDDYGLDDMSLEAGASARSADCSIEDLLGLKPPGNTLYIMAVCVLASILVIMGQRNILLLYVKQEFKMDDVTISYLFAVEAAARGLAPMVIIPLLIKPRVKSRLGELRLLQAMFLASGVLTGLLGVYKNVPFLFVVKGILGLFITTPIGFVRSILSTEVGPALQGKVLSMIATLEALTAIFGSVLFSNLYAATNEYPALSFFIMAGLFAVAALVPCFMNDDKRTFNLRAYLYRKTKLETELETVMSGMGQTTSLPDSTTEQLTSNASPK